MKQIIKNALLVLMFALTGVFAQEANEKNDQNFIPDLSLYSVKSSITNFTTAEPDMTKMFEQVNLKFAPVSNTAIFKFDIINNDNINLNLRIDEINFSNSLKTDKKISLTIKINLFQ